MLKSYSDRVRNGEPCISTVAFEVGMNHNRAQCVQLRKQILSNERRLTRSIWRREEETRRRSAAYGVQHYPFSQLLSQ